MYLFFDTETTGLPKNSSAPTTDFENWPRLVQLAYILYDETGKLILSEDFIVKPDGFIIPEPSSQIHRITNERAHNVYFDKKIVGSEYLRNGFEDCLQFKKKICTMMGPRSHFKGWKSLTELHTRLFGSGFEEAHNAAVDIQATARCFWEMRKRNII